MSDIYDLLNDKQKEAVFHTEGPLLILAGAGAGKTRVLTHRIAYLIDEKNVPPYNIMAITFTNKAAAEMKERVQNLVPYGDSVWVATFHSSCVRILRRHIDLLGYDTDFSIYDTDDQKTVVRHVVKELNLDPKMYKERAMLSFISDCKNEMISPSDLYKEAGSDYRKVQEARIYEAYENRLKQNNALDFDDLLLKTVDLFKSYPDVLQNYQERFKYILVDEYQDTNTVQFEFIYLLAKKYQNLCVVGDDDQSIYKFRGADIRNILEFESHFKGTKVVKLEQNYRSTTHILDAANAVISHNRGRKEKHLWSKLGEGADVSFEQYDNGNQEAEEVIRKIMKLVREGENHYKDFAVLYRTNAQSRLFEEQCVNRNVPYRLVGGVNFYQRQEVKDLLAYLKTLASGKDDVATARIINVPKRGIGDTTMTKVQNYATNHGLSLMEAIHHCQDIPGIDRAKGKLAEFDHLIGRLREFAGILPDGRLKEDGPTFGEIFQEIVDRTNYLETLDEYDEDQQEQKKDNIQELLNKAVDFEDNYDGEGRPTLVEFLEEVSLVADIDAVDDNDDKILLMTLHSSKGLEFPVVFLCGMEDGLFPSYMSMESGDPSDVEEERRLCYVGITRAMRSLYLTCAKSRMVHGETQWNNISRFVKEIPEEMIGLRRKVEKIYQTPLESYKPPKPAYETKATFGKTFEIKKDSALDYGVGDRVHHMKYGDGVVTEIIDGKKDFEVAVNFDQVGEKRMYASFAKLQRI